MNILLHLILISSTAPVMAHTVLLSSHPATLDSLDLSAYQELIDHYRGRQLKYKLLKKKKK